MSEEAYRVIWNTTVGEFDEPINYAYAVYLAKQLKQLRPELDVRWGDRLELENALVQYESERLEETEAVAVMYLNEGSLVIPIRQILACRVVDPTRSAPMPDTVKEIGFRPPG